jgi:hypothetical protein
MGSTLNVHSGVTVNLSSEVLRKVLNKDRGGTTPISVSGERLKDQLDSSDCHTIGISET